MTTLSIPTLRRTSSKWFQPGTWEAAIRPITSAEPGEAGGALLLALNLFLILTAYYMLKTVRETLVLVEHGAEVKSYSAAGQALLLLLFVPAYSWLAGKLTRFRLTAVLTLFFCSNLLILGMLSSAGVGVGIAFYLWLGVFSLAIIAQFWAFANDLYTEEQGKRLFPVVGLGSSAGALFGSRLGARLAAAEPRSVMLAATGLLLAGLAISWWINRQACQACMDQRANNAEKVAGRGAFSIVLSNRYFLLIGLMVLILNVVNTGGEFLLGKFVLSEADAAAVGASNVAAARRAFVGEFYGNYYALTGLIGLLLQGLVVSRLFRWIGVRGSLFLLPAIALGGYVLLVALPALSIAFTTKVCENATDYSVQNTARQALFLGVSREAKYKAKTAIDTFFYRAGDVTQAGIVWAGTELALSSRHFAAINVGFGIVLLAVVAALFHARPPKAV